MIPDPTGKRILLAFSDPAGAKAALSFGWKCRPHMAEVRAVSDRAHSFYADFGIPVDILTGIDPDRLLDGVDLLVTGTSVPVKLELPLIGAARRRKVTSVAFVDHWTHLVERFKSDAGLVLPDVIGLVNQKAQALAVSAGLPAGRMVVSGNPHHAFLRAWVPPIEREPFLAGLGLDPAEPYVLYAPEPFSSFSLKQVYGFDEIDGLRLVIDALARMDRPPALVIKSHPHQKHEAFEEYLAREPAAKVCCVRDGDLALYAYHAAAVLGFFSNSLVEARVLGVNVVRPLSLLKPGAPDPLAEWDGPGFATCRSTDEVADALERSLGKPAVRR